MVCHELIVTNVTIDAHEDFITAVMKGGLNPLEATVYISIEIETSA